jgi:hypothetical protein
MMLLRITEDQEINAIAQRVALLLSDGSY